MTASEAQPAGVRLTAGLGVTFSPWPELVRFRRQTLMRRLFVRREAPLMQQWQPWRTFVLLALPSGLARCRPQSLMLHRWICFAEPLRRKWRLYFQWSSCLP